MDAANVSEEGTVSFHGYKVWYRIVGTGEKTGRFPLLCLHGGPGIPHDYLEPLEAMAATRRRVIFYDQLGCGNSDHPHDPSLWSVDLFVEELGIVRQALDLNHVHLLGHSWGGMLAMEYALRQPAGLVSLILASSLASMPQSRAEINRLLSELPIGVQQTLLKHEKAGTTDNPAYLESMMVFYNRYVCRLDPWPEYVYRSFEKFMQNQEVYEALMVPDELKGSSPLQEWDIVDRLGEIQVPTLITCGRYDQVTPAISETLHQGIPGSQWVVFERSSHMPHAEEPKKYMQVLDQFLSMVEAET